ncbi:MAG: hypothetical protein KTV68_09770 [Acidimicrobiia bacterium]|nr:hypothetical protein [Acidimicrobiia bacterium]MCY4433201.1 hypothetical protein [bacterium]
MSKIVLIDDEARLLKGLHDAVVARLPDVSVATWRPSKRDDAAEAFKECVDDGETVLVATDDELTASGLRGFFGTTIVSWCQQLAIPVGYFSRRPQQLLSRDPELFALRIPSNDEEGADYIEAVYNGFTELSTAISRLNLDPGTTSLAKYLAHAIQRPHLESDFALYMARLGHGGTAVARRIIDSQSATSTGERSPEAAISYTLGHYLANVITRFAGPLLRIDALCAYVGADTAEREELANMFDEARYEGPFSGLDQLFWRESVDAALEDPFDLEADSADDVGTFHRAAIETRLGRTLAQHECDRNDCGGRRGGFHCPFTNRPVCVRSDCSVAGSGWIPSGATSSRVEREYHDEWAPLLGQ